jgi:hypothetical protein
LEHFTDLSDEINKVKLLLKNDGILFVAVPGVFFVHHSYEGDFSNYLQNAHAYGFTLKSLRSVLSRLGLKLIYGDESVLAIFIKSKKTKKVLREDYKDIITYLGNTEKLRWYFLVRQRIYEFVVEVLKSLSLLDFAVNIIYLFRKKIKEIRKIL